MEPGREWNGRHTSDAQPKDAGRWPGDEALSSGERVYQTPAPRPSPRITGNDHAQPDDLPAPDQPEPASPTANHRRRKSPSSPACQERQALPKSAAPAALTEGQSDTGQPGGGESCSSTWNEFYHPATLPRADHQQEKGGRIWGKMLSKEAADRRKPDRGVFIQQALSRCAESRES